MQGLFRNPLADPALVRRIRAAGAFAAAAAIVISDSAWGASLKFIQLELLPIAAFVGSLTTTIILYKIASREGRTSVAIFLLAGLAIAAIANAGIEPAGIVADDRQLRDITFWLLGSLSGATWPKASMVAPVVVLALVVIPFIARGLDVLVLGEAEAFHTGIDVERLKKISIVLISRHDRCGCFDLRSRWLRRHRCSPSATYGDRSRSPSADYLPPLVLAQFC